MNVSLQLFVSSPKTLFCLFSLDRFEIILKGQFSLKNGISEVKVLFSNPSIKKNFLKSIELFIKRSSENQHAIQIDKALKPV